MSKKKTITITIITVIVVCICIGGYFAYSSYVTSQRAKMNNQLSSMITDMKQNIRSITADGNEEQESLELIQSLPNEINQDIAEVKEMQNSMFNDDDLKAKEGDILETLNYMNALVDMLKSQNTMYNDAVNLGNNPTNAQLANIINQCNDILNGSSMEIIKNNENNTNIEKILGVSTLYNPQSAINDLKNVISEAQQAETNNDLNQLDIMTA